MKKGLIIVNTGDSKGKSTAGFGTIFRAWGHGMNVAVVQFIKHENAHFGEIKAGRKIGIRWEVTGTGFVMPGDDPAEAIEHVKNGWRICQEIIQSGEYDMLMMDEFTYPLQYGWLNIEEVLGWIGANKPEMMHIIITGRGAPQPLIDFADMVTEMTPIKHPFEKGIKAQIGVEF
ncbi:MAG: cob(I)yrinic acid a,c-diamide adenosyltransferase [Anaerolineae bacterium]|jgi:cob(I)alamin adenosyltransferase|nr:cob(I)yrinic acid a,c-diamide adenosyltransferase [Anaerolineae bacterium]